MYDHDIGLDWAQSVMAIARMTKKNSEVREMETASDIGNLKAFLKSLKGTKRIIFEESTSSQWLYTELYDFVDEVIVCDPRRNDLLKEGPKTDKIDARKLLKLMRADLVKPVYHSAHEFIYMRKLVSGYIDLVKSGVRIKNQRSALMRAFGKDIKEVELDESAAKFVLKGQDEGISSYEANKARYEKEFSRLCKKYKVLQNLKSCPGLKEINSVKVAAAIVDARRFSTAGKFLAYCGLIKYEKLSGGKSYGKVRTNYNRTLKNVFDVAALACIQAGENNFLKKDYIYLIEVKKLAPHQARHAIARKAAVIAWGVMKSGKKFDINKRRKDQSKKRIK